MKKQIGNPSDTDRFMMKKGANCTLREAKNRHEFWLVLFTVTIIIGISRMIDDNAALIAASNSNLY